MKKCTTVLFFLALSFNLLAQPTTITWQGKLLDASGNAITQNNVAMTFAMFDASTGGNQLWPSSGAVVKVLNVLNGLYSVPLGTGTGDDIAFTAAMFNGKTPWLEVKVGTETLPRTEITNVPFALISNELSASGWKNPGELGKTTPNTGKFTSVETVSVKITTGASNGKVLTSDANGNGSWVTPQYEASGTATGQMKYWNGSAWVIINPGLQGQILKFKNGVPTWVDDYIGNLSVGDYYQGGYIFYFLQSGDAGYDANVRHGLIVSPITIGSADWGCMFTYIGTTYPDLLKGASNTAQIVAKCNSGAAWMCDNLVLNGYDDWYLPSYNELAAMCAVSSSIPNFEYLYYWSSWEFNAENGWSRNPVSCSGAWGNRNYVLPVKAVRSF